MAGYPVIPSLLMLGGGLTGIASPMPSYPPTPAFLLLFQAPQTPVPLPPDLVAAVAARLRATPVVASLLGEVPGVRKALWVDEALGTPALPWVVLKKFDFRRRFTSGGNFVAYGSIMVELNAASSIQAQTLSDAIHKGQPGDPPGALDDPPLVWRGGRLMKFRASDSSFGDFTSPSVGVAAAYQRTLVFDVMFSGQIT